MADDRAMDLRDELRRRGGIASTASLRAAGVSEHTLRRAKATGLVRTLRRGWVASADADALAAGAIERGVLLSCVTVAERSRLWVPTHGAVHVVARPHSSRLRIPDGVVVHWAEPVIPRIPDAIEDSLLNALVLVAQCQPTEAAMIIWESALNARLVDAELLRGFDLPPAARGILERARPFADSGLETIMVFRLRWMGVRMLPQAWVVDRRVDLLIGARLVVQLDGATHTGAQRTKDIAHDAQLMLRGYHVLRFSYEQIMHGWHDVQAVIMEAVALGRHL